MDEILLPRPAATVLPLRDGPEGFEVLMLRRNLRSDFVGGAYVFPGGGVDVADSGPPAEHLVVGPSDAEASERLGIAHGGLAYYVACLRELFEEAGLLVICDAEGHRVDIGDPETIERLASHRRRVNDNSLGFLEVMREERLLLDLRELEYLAHWVTPIGPPRRFDTRFFVTLAPSGQVATHDAGETVADTWVRPVDALRAQSRGEFEMILPTIKNLEEIQHFDTAEAVLEHARFKKQIPRIEPRIVLDGDVMKILLPGEEGYED